MTWPKKIHIQNMARTLATSFLLLVVVYSLIRRLFQLKLVIDGAASTTFINNSDVKLTSFLICQLPPWMPTS
jgi:hypothetical protein